MKSTLGCEIRQRATRGVPLSCGEKKRRGLFFPGRCTMLTVRFSPHLVFCFRGKSRVACLMQAERAGEALNTRQPHQPQPRSDNFPDPSRRQV